MEMIKKLGLLALIIACVAAGYIAMKKYYASHENVKVQGIDQNRYNYCINNKLYSVHHNDPGYCIGWATPKPGRR